MSNRLSWREEHAILLALGEMLAGEGPQGVDDEDEAADIIAAAESAQRKLWARQERRR